MRSVNCVGRTSVIAFPAFLALGFVDRKLFGERDGMTRAIAFAQVADRALLRIAAQFSQPSLGHKTIG